MEQEKIYEMSKMFMCDRCQILIHEDSRSEKGDCHEIWIDRSSSYHICKHCYKFFMEDFLERRWSEDNQQYEPRKEWTDRAMQATPFNPKTDPQCEDCVPEDRYQCELCRLR